MKFKFNGILTEKRSNLEIKLNLKKVFLKGRLFENQEHC